MRHTSQSFTRFLHSLFPPRLQYSVTYSHTSHTSHAWPAKAASFHTPAVSPPRRTRAHGARPHQSRRWSSALPKRSPPVTVQPERKRARSPTVGPASRRCRLSIVYDMIHAASFTFLTPLPPPTGRFLLRPPFFTAVSRAVAMCAVHPIPPPDSPSPPPPPPEPPSGRSLSPHIYSIAPMMDVTDRHHRALTRLITTHATLYTEMVVDRTLIHNPIMRQRELRIPSTPPQSPLVLQLGGSNPVELEAAATFAAAHNYDAVNLNCGCPSPKVAGKGCFGAALMRTPHVVADATRRMTAVLPPHIPVTVKCRIGVDDHADYSHLAHFVRVVSHHGCVRHFIIHARKALLAGLSPAQNRTVPPLRYNFVYDLLRDFPDLTFSINGGIKTLHDVNAHLARGVHGTMVGRAVMDRPWHALADVDTVLYNAAPDFSRTRRHILRQYVQYAEQEMTESGCPIRAVVRPILNLFAGEKNGKRFRREIDTCLRENVSIGDLIERACATLPDDVLDALPPSVQNDVRSNCINTEDGGDMDGSLHVLSDAQNLTNESVSCNDNFGSDRMLKAATVSET